MTDIPSIQSILRESHLDGWLLFDFRGANPIAAHIAGLPGDAMFSRRWAYWIPAQGEPQWLVHAIELAPFRDRPQQPRSYVRWQDLEHELRAMFGDARRIAMEYSAQCAIPYISRVDAGTLEMIRGLGVEVVSSADLVQAAEARWSPEQLEGHRRAAAALLHIKDETFDYVAFSLREGVPLTEYAVQQWMMQRITEVGLTAAHAPIVAVNGHAADPHYGPTPERNAAIKRGDFLLLDLWAKGLEPDAVYADITWVGLCTDAVPQRYQHVCDIVAAGRDAALAYIEGEMAAGRLARGCDADDACRRVIEEAGYGDYILHRTGHSLGTDGHGNGANLDNLETNDTRQLMPGTAFTIEPGIYLPGDFGVRLEIDVYVHETGIEVTTLPLQHEIIPLLR
ncbi:MAG: aminopeptidase P family protein [Caldilineae bacterium]|nr:aminopeptidase P family protein [Caldilineae bacterium]